MKLIKISIIIFLLSTSPHSSRMSGLHQGIRTQMQYIRLFIAALVILLIYGTVYAETYWVDDNGAAAWSACKGATPLSGTNACSVATMVAGAWVAGDLIYFREGTYNYSTLYGQHISINSKAGSAGNMIELKNYNGEVVSFVGTYGIDMSGIFMTNSSYIKINGLRFTDYARPVRVSNKSHHIELTNMVVTTATSPYRSIGGVNLDEDCAGGSSYNCPVSNIWIHNNSISKLSAGSNAVTDLHEGGEAFRVGYANGTCGYSATTSVTELTIGTGEQTLTIGAGVWLAAGDIINIRYDASNYMRGTVTSYTGTTLVANITTVLGEGTYSSWGVGACTAGDNKYITFENNYLAYGGHNAMDFYGEKSVIRNNRSQNEPWYPADIQELTVIYEPEYTNEDYNGLYSHRVWQLTDTQSRQYQYIVVEGNILGPAGVNPNNDGSTGLTIAAPGCIIRYNKVFGAMNNSMKTKYGDSYGWQASGGSRSYLYNNTLYQGGYGYPYFQTCTNPPNPTCPKALVGFRWYAPSDTPGCVLKNNIVYGSYGAVENSYEDIQDNTSTPTAVYANNLCTNADATKCSVSGQDPKFVATTMTDNLSWSDPMLNIASDSPARDAAANLTVVAESDGGSGTSLYVSDSHYFQAGSSAENSQVGADMSSVVGDCILVGAAVGSAVETQITDIDYDNHILTISPAISRSDGDLVWLYKKSDGVQVLYGTAPDIGAHEFNPGNHSFSGGATHSFSGGSTITWQ